MATLTENITLDLPDNDVGQLLDGLEVLIEQWDYTARYHEHGVIEDEYMIRECTDADEANSIAGWYREIAAMIRAQRDAQRAADIPKWFHLSARRAPNSSCGVR